MAREVVRNFDEEWAAEEALRDDKVVVIGGTELILARDVHPSVLAEMEQLGSEGQQVAAIRERGEKPPPGMLDDVFARYAKIADECFAPESRDDWKTLTTRRGEGELGWYKLQELVPWLISQIGERPFTNASTSGATPETPRSETRSTASFGSPPAAGSQPLRQVSAGSST